MMRVRHTTDTARAVEAAEREFEQLAERMHALVAEGARSLRDGDTYQDRTGSLRRETQAEMIEDGGGLVQGEIRVSLAMATKYASHVVDRGFSHFDEVAKDIDRELDKGLRAMARRIERGGK